MNRALLGILLALIVCSSSAVAQETGYQLSCEPTEAEDVGRVIRNQIYDALRTDKTIKERVINVSVEPLDRAKGAKGLTQLLDGLGFSFDPETLAVSIGGNAFGHQCYTPAEARIYVKVRRKNGTVTENSVKTVIQVPGAWATKSRIVIPGK
jgi:hypothetical protein